jgi:hypothetical protein
MGNNSSSGKNQINIDMTKPGMTIAKQIANIVYNGLPNQYKNQIYKDKIYAIIREKIGPNDSFVQILDSKPGDAQVNWDAIKSKTPHKFIDDVTKELYDQNKELIYNPDNNSTNFEIGKGGRKTRKHNKSKRILKKYKKDKYKKSIKK